MLQLTEAWRFICRRDASRPPEKTATVACLLWQALQGSGGQFTVVLCHLSVIA
ncbi:hypothetical protein ACGVWS_01585 [Enterobacteriaceae bacterium LUAb1]